MHQTPKVASAAPPSPAGADDQVLPRVFSLDAEHLAAAGERLAAGDPALLPALDRLRREADEALDATPLSVMDKPKTAPSGDKHDFLSLGPYWWPDPARPDGLPYLRRDGEVNPESRAGNDHAPLARVCALVETLALAYTFTGQESYAGKAAALLRVWFLDPATRMNPNLEYAQGIPGHCTGRGIGIIDSRPLVTVTDALGLLEDSPAWTPALCRGMREWFGAFLHWMLTSRNGRDEAGEKNNHGTWYRVQAAAYALAAGDAAAARQQAEAGRALIAGQIEPDGRQPLELARTRSYTYSVFNVRAFFTLAELGRRVGLDLYYYRTGDGRGLRAALDHLAPYLADPQRWPHRQITPVVHPDEELGGLLHRGALVFPDADYPPLPDGLAPARFQLLWPAVAAAIPSQRST